LQQHKLTSWQSLNHEIANGSLDGLTCWLCSHRTTSRMLFGNCNATVDRTCGDEGTVTVVNHDQIAARGEGVQSGKQGIASATGKGDDIWLDLGGKPGCSGFST
jgi:hypothetical protein